jgi:hypothetical protein
LALRTLLTSLTTVAAEPVSDQDLDARLRAVWPYLTWRYAGDAPRSIVVMQSISAYVPPRWQPLMPAYEERFLCYLLGLIAPGTHVVYVTSMPVHPRLVDYWLSLVPGLDTAGVRERLTMVPVVDARSLPLTRKVREHPGVVRRIRDAVPDPRCAVTIGHTVTEDDVEVARLLGIPVYGAHPRFARWGTKSGSREMFVEAGVPVAAGCAGVRTRGDVAEAIDQLRARDPGLRRVIVKLDEGAGGIGNGTIVLDERPGSALCEEIDFEEPEITVDDYYEHLEREGGVVEAFLVGDDVRSPSVQVRMTPFGETDILSTHEQVLGGPNGLSYLGCTMPAARDYSAVIAEQALAVGKRLTEEGVVGRCSIDFLAVRRGSTWATYASEINLRAGGTTHPLSTLASLTRGGYDVEEARFLSADGTPKFYAATDHLEDEAYAALATDDLLDVLPAAGLGWDHETQTGSVFHMASAIGGTGNVGLTAIADSPSGAHALFERSRSALAAAATRIGG